MITPPLPLTRDLVLVGGGHTHALVLRRWGMDPVPGARLTVINPAAAAPYTGMLPGLIAGHYRPEALDIDVVRLARFAGARLIAGLCTGIDPLARTVGVAGRPPVRYDVLSLDFGVGWENPAIDGFAAHAVPVKPMRAFARAWDRFAAHAAAGGAAPRVAVIGAGVAGVEIAMAMHHRLSDAGHTPRIAVIEARRALSGTAPRARDRLLAELAARGIALHEGDPVAAVTADRVVLASGREVPAGFIASAAGAQPQRWVAGTGLALTDGWVRVGPELRSTSHPQVFAAGDCAHLAHAPRPKAGVFAVRAAPVLTHNLRAALTGGRPRRWTPQTDFLKLVSLGGRRAVGERGGWALSGGWVWRWKDRIDRRFMRKFHDLTPMPGAARPRTVALGAAEARPHGQPPCAGCGAKLGGDALRRALLVLPDPVRADVARAPGDDAAVLTVGGARQVLTTDHLRAFTDDPWTLARIAAVHALGDVWAMGAAPQAALAQVVLPYMAPALQEATLREVMAAAAQVFAEAGAEVVGGHSSEGPEMTLGFTVTGLAERAPILLSGARPGDALLLTKPIGSGTVLAGEMALRATGDEVLGTLAAMQQPQGAAAAILAGAHAMTDVTGFGLAGHLGAMMAASGTAARVDLAAVPLLPGAERLAAAGVRSTLHAANRAGAGPVTAPDSAAAALLFDPQTAGGLLAAVDAADAAALLRRLREAGHDAARIGTVVAGPPMVTVD
ncbi:selenide, water dikinase SelD [Rhodobacteraceae bacterium 2CG4]|uniref:Selenide, water dikinase SelD n=1 Tax=Halovulum marinum TaxID=2662447 RepID=A0A6L5Z0T8_9RHOB|nr:selenide, water dikinase SelD [Halovulum marinum]MSU90157.1 selenide, water dikinase SelD [Halovulum marinum]